MRLSSQPDVRKDVRAPKPGLRSLGRNRRTLRGWWWESIWAELQIARNYFPLGEGAVLKIRSSSS